MGGGTITAVAAALMLVLAPGASAAVDEGMAGPPASAPAPSGDRVIVEWAPGARPAERREARAGADVAFAEDLGGRRFQAVDTVAGQTPAQAIGELRADPTVLLAERDRHLTLDSLPDDPLFSRLWGLRNTGVGIEDFVGAAPGADIDVASAWARTVGTPSTVVADIDTGYRFDHPDLAGVAWTNPGEVANGLDDDGNGIVDDLHGADFIGADGEHPTTDGDPTDDDLISGGHGTHTAGTIGAAGDNGIGITGVAQDARIMPLRVCSRAGEGSDCLLSAAIAAVNYAGAEGARAANMSFGSSEYTAALGDAIAANPQTLFVVSAGNESHDADQVPRPPCTVGAENLICVAATDQADRLASFSNWGARTVDLGAPGTQVLSTYPVHDYLADDFEADDFASSWTESGPDGGFARTDEAPLTSFGIADSPGAAPASGSIRASTSPAVTLPPTLHGCVLEFDFWRPAEPSGTFSYELWADGELATTIGLSPSRPSGHYQSHDLSETLAGSGAVALRLVYDAGSDPRPGDGVWLDDLALHCAAGPGDADGYAYLDGTSMATPHVTGAAALLFSLRPTATVAQVRRALLDSVDPLASLAGKTTSGGRLDVGAAADILDDSPPPPPTLIATAPASPGQSTRPRLIGTAQRGTTVSVFADPACAGAPLLTTTAAELAAPGVEVPVAIGATIEFSAKASDAVPLSSACSAPITYTQGTGSEPWTLTESSDVTPPPIETPDSTTVNGPDRTPAAPVAPAPATSSRRCVVPRLTGRTLPAARRALRKAGCRLTKVRKPTRRRARQAPLVVRSSRPAAGRRPANGSVAVTLGPRKRQPRGQTMLRDVAPASTQGRPPTR